MSYANQHTINARLFQLIEAIGAGCDPDFDLAQDELEREFAELRCQLGNQA